MATDGIKISTAEVVQTADTIKTLNGQLDSRLEDIKKEMNDLAQAWQSEASETLRANFNTLSAKFVDYKKVVDEYAKFLKETVNVYEATENALNKNATAFK